MPDLDDKKEKLKTILLQEGSVAVAFSGGVDSTFLLRFAHDILGDGCIAITADSPMIPRHEADSAASFCREYGIKHILFDPGALEDPVIRSNPKDRCYHCKKKIFTKILELALENGAKCVLDGTNTDDEGDFRPGMKALAELGIRSPLKEAGLSKSDIRELSKELGLDTWDMPSFACLATRIPYGEEITADKLAMIENAETVLREEGFSQYRVRAHGNLARIEVAKEDIVKLTENGDIISEKIKKCGFVYVTADLAGYKTGSMNNVLS